ncbi:MAG: hypothetical protein QOF94_1521 [Acidobacteriaceae bacterium]
MERPRKEKLFGLRRTPAAGSSASFAHGAEEEDAAD